MPYGLIVLSLVVALIYRYSYIARIWSIALLCLSSLLHLVYLSAPHRLADEEVGRQTEELPAEEAPNEYELLLVAMQKLGQREAKMFVALTLAWAILAIMPVRRKVVVVA